MTRTRSNQAPHSSSCADCRCSVSGMIQGSDVDTHIHTGDKQAFLDREVLFGVTSSDQSHQCRLAAKHAAPARCFLSRLDNLSLPRGGVQRGHSETRVRAGWLNLCMGHEGDIQTLHTYGHDPICGFAACHSELLQEVVMARDEGALSRFFSFSCDIKLVIPDFRGVLLQTQTAA